ncbi:ACGX-repeat peptide [Massilicoli timonensis]|uniref:ACGX-repeat peptide n=1 Tax=Massilicoli timonensis TaxID=2015901 RepID=UPI0034E391BB
MEVKIMALSNLFGWNKKMEAVPASACGASDKPAEKPAACGSACGAGDKPAETPAACGSACGAGDK